MIAALTAVSCSPRSLPSPTFRPPFPGDSAGTIVDLARVRHDGIGIAAGAALTWPVPQAVSGRLRFGWGAKATGPVALTITIAGTIPDRPIRRTFTASATGSDFYYEDLAIDTQAPAVIRIAPDPAVETVISDLRIVRPSRNNDALIVVLLDTTRRDAVGLYGSRRPTTPALDRILAHGWKAERAWALASWTTPSVATVLTGMVPGALEDDSGAPLGITANVPTMGHDFARADWSTAHFNANPALNADNGFNRGFTTFYTPPFAVASMALPGSDMLARVPAWIRAHEGERFFLYLQLIEPHEPYGPPDRPKGKTPFDPDYTGHYQGDESHFALSFDPAIRPGDVAHLRALYDDDVRYADLLIGQFWNGLDAALRDRATLVFLSDHGEEFLEHQGWKHGPSLYDEVLHVPFIVRPGNGRSFRAVPPDTLVSLADLLPTIEHFLDLPARRKVNGVDLLDEKNWTRDALPAIHMLTGGAARAVVVRRERKLFFFDRFGTRGVPDERADPMAHRVALHLREFMPSLCSFDLVEDPLERHEQPPVAPTEGADWRAIEESLAHTRRGLEVRAMGAATTGRLRFAIEAGSPQVERFALEPDDLVQLDGAAAQFDLHLTPGDVDGALFPASEAGRVRVTMIEGCARWNTVTIAPGETRALEPIGYAIPRIEAAADCASVFVWRNRGGQTTRSPQEEDEARAKLRALGYIH